MNQYRSYIILLLIVVMAGLSAWSQCVIENNIEIVPLSTTSLKIEVDRLEFSDLSQDQGLCAVFIEFDHGRVENLRLKVISPAGQEVTLLGPGILGGGVTSGVNWEVSFIPCSFFPSPDNGIPPVWDNAQPWAFLTTYTGSYHPNNGCLEDFDQGSAEGVWQIEIENLGNSTGTIKRVELIFCNGNIVRCTGCFLDAGTWLDLYQPFCEGDPSLQNFDFNFLIPPSTTFTEDDILYAHFKEQTLIDIVSDPRVLLSSLEVGLNEVCILAVSENSADELNLSGEPNFRSLQELRSIWEADTLCLDLTETCLQIEIFEAEESIQIDEELCPGDSLEIQGIKYAAPLDTLLYESIGSNLCGRQLVVNLLEVDLVAEIESPVGPIICQSVEFLDASESTVNTGTITNYSWSTLDGELINDFGSIAQIRSGGTYYLEVSYANCTDVDSITIEELNEYGLLFTQLSSSCGSNDRIPILVEEDLPLGLGPIDIQVETIEGPPSFSFELSGDTIFVDLPGEYMISTSFGSCTRTDALIVEPDQSLLELEVGVSDSLRCSLDEVVLTFTTNVQDPEFSIAGPVEGVTLDLMWEVSEPGRYTITVTDAQDCSFSVQVEVFATDELPSVMIPAIELPCSGLGANLQPEIMGVVDSVIWSGPKDFSSRELSPMVIDTGTYLLDVFANGGCKASASVSVAPMSNFIDFDFVDTLISCLDTFTRVCITNLVSDKSIESYEWFDSAGSLVSLETCLDVSSANSFNLILTDEDECSVSKQVLIEDIRTIPLVELNAYSDNFSCDSSQQTLFLELNDLQDLDLVWSPMSTIMLTNNPLEVLISEGGWYYIEVVDQSNGCSTMDSLFIDTANLELESVALSINQPTCSEEALLWIEDPAAELGAVLLNEISVDYSMPISITEGIQIVSLLDQKGCSIDTTLEIELIDLPHIDLGPDQLIDKGETLVISPDISVGLENFNISWSPDSLFSCQSCLEQTLEVSEQLEISSTIIDDLGCISTDTLIIFVNQNTEIYFPSIFNASKASNDGVYSIGFNPETYKSISFSIYDRWGNLVSNISQELTGNSIEIWDGNFKGKPAETGVYVYMAKLLQLNDVELSFYGSLTLMR